MGTSSPSSFTVVSTFAGCGGSSLGYQWAGGKVLCAIEWDQNAVDTYRANFPETPMLHRDIATVPVDEVLELTGLAPGELDILDGSPPCQGFSTAGKRIMDDPRNSLFREYVRLIEGLRPRVFVMENVSGMVKGKMKLVFAEIMRSLKGAGYRVSARKLNAMYFGVPQSRERMVFVGVRDGIRRKPSHPRARTWPSPPALVYDGAVLTGAQLRFLQEHAAKQRAKGNSFSYRLHDPAKPVPTLIKNPTLGGGTIVLAHQGRYRVYGPGDLKVVGSFPQDYQFAGGLSAMWQRIGNSVPPRFMQAIAEHIRDEILAKVATRERDGFEFPMEEGD